MQFEEISLLPTHRQELCTEIACLEKQLFPDDSWSETTIFELLQQPINHAIIVHLNHQFAGYCLYQVMFENAEILRIGVAPKFQRQGIAQNILHQIFNILLKKQVITLLLEVREDNVSALALYKKMEFTPIHVRKNYYHLLNGHCVNAVILQKIICQ